MSDKPHTEAKPAESRSAYMIDARVHEGVLWRLARLRRQHPEHVIVKPETWRGLAP